MQSNSKTIEEYLESLPEDRKSDIKAVRNLILSNLPKGYEEKMNWGMITYEIPLSRYSGTYNKQPLSYIALASQKNYMSVYLTGLYSQPGGEDRFRNEWAKTGKKLDMGKSCIRFKSISDLNLDLITGVVSSMTPDEYISFYEKSREK